MVDEIINGFERDANGNWLNRTFHHDQVNSVVALSDHNGVTAQKRAYTPFGLDLSSSGESTNSLAYTGREQDNESGLYYYRARYYDPEIGRFLSEDPLGFEAGVNFYAYVNNNPINFNDPLGKEPIGLTLGGSINLVARIGINGTVLFDTTTFDLAWVNSTEQGIAVAAPTLASADVFLNGVWTDPGVSVFDFEGSSFVAGSSINLPLGPNGAVSVPFTLDFDEYGTSYPLTDLNRSAPNIYEAGLSLGTPGVDVFGVIGDSSVYDTSIVRDTANFGIDALNAGAEFFGIDGRINNIPSASEVYSGSAGGGFVLYPSKVNTNMIQQVYSK